MEHSQLELMRRFILQEAHACKGADPEMLTVFGVTPCDLLHPHLATVGGVHVTTLEDGKQQTIFVCKPAPEYEPTVIQFWEGDKLSEHKAVYFCPNATLVMRPTEADDLLLIQPDIQEGRETA
jgi:hypothetical protein